MNHLAVSHFLSRLGMLTMAVALASCGTSKNPAGEPPNGGNHDPNSFAALRARFAKSVHVVADLNENGEATIGELRRVSPELNEAKFEGFDEDNSGGLSLEEATKAVESGEVSAKLQRQFDPDADGLVEPAEWKRFNKMVLVSDDLRNFVQVESIFNL